ncbi:hypothetical protein BDN67DRAFT_966035 [Paxillus ammoniavirescens]|nr:hypothetical protein BDN67DRAFT_966035 [Paxillus ammoniavirescens]
MNSAKNYIDMIATTEDLIEDTVIHQSSKLILTHILVGLAAKGATHRIVIALIHHTGGIMTTALITEIANIGEKRTIVITVTIVTETTEVMLTTETTAITAIASATGITATEVMEATEIMETIEAMGDRIPTSPTGCPRGHRTDRTVTLVKCLCQLASIPTLYLTTGKWGQPGTTQAHITPAGIKKTSLISVRAYVRFTSEGIAIRCTIDLALLCVLSDL